MADQRLQDVESERKTALAQSNKTYDNMIDKSDSYYQEQIDASKQWAEEQARIQQEKTDFAIQQIEQQKEQTTKEYKREQSGAYVDWQKESNRYGVNAEQMASAGLMNSGYSESSQVSMYNTYQNRVSRALESYNLAIQNYNNQIHEARLHNNAILAEIAYNALQQQLELSLQGFQYENSLVQAKVGQQNTVNSRYDSKYQDVLNQINKENSIAEEVRLYNKSLLADSVNTRVKLNQVFTDQKLSDLELDGNSKIVTSGGKYYAQAGDDLIDLSPIQNTIKGVLQASAKKKNTTDMLN